MGTSPYRNIAAIQKLAGQPVRKVSPLLVRPGALSPVEGLRPTPGRPLGSTQRTRDSKGQVAYALGFGIKLGSPSKAGRGGQGRPDQGGGQKNPGQKNPVRANNFRIG